MVRVGRARWSLCCIAVFTAGAVLCLPCSEGQLRFQDQSAGTFLSPLSGVLPCGGQRLDDGGCVVTLGDLDGDAVGRSRVEFRRGNAAGEGRDYEVVAGTRAPGQMTGAVTTTGLDLYYSTGPRSVDWGVVRGSDAESPFAGVDTGWHVAPQLVDLNGDGRLDLAFSSVNATDAVTIVTQTSLYESYEKQPWVHRVLLNRGPQGGSPGPSGRTWPQFDEVTGTSEDPLRDVPALGGFVLAHLDGDGVLDMVTCRRAQLTSLQDRASKGLSGAGIDLVVVYYGVAAGAPGSLVVTSFERDVVQSEYFRAAFEDEDAPAKGFEVPFSVTAIDWSNDGRRDLVFGLNDAAPVAAVQDVPVGGGRGSFRLVATAPTDVLRPVLMNGLRPKAGQVPSAYDIDADGDDDVLITTLAASHRGVGLDIIFCFRNMGTTGSGALVRDVANCPPQLCSAAPQLARNRLRDMNADGKLDLVQAMLLGRITLFINTGTRTRPDFGGGGQRIYTPPSYSTAYIYPNGVEVFDVDSDGDLDIIVGQYGGLITLFPNEGDASNPSFPSVRYQGEAGNPFPAILPADVGSGSATPTSLQRVAPACADFDLDGDIDCLIGLYRSQPIHMENQGNSTHANFVVKGFNVFAGVAGFIHETSLCGETVDLDGNGMYDFVAGDQFGRAATVFTMAAYGKFGPGNEMIAYMKPYGDVYRNELILRFPGVGAVTAEDGEAAACFGDLDGDGDLDIFVNGVGARNGRMYRNLASDCADSCNGHGTCARDPALVALVGSASCVCLGQWSGPRCERCAAGWGGDQCNVPCPPSAGNPCSGHGTCFEGRTGNGTCACETYFDGPTCAGPGCPAGMEPPPAALEPASVMNSTATPVRCQQCAPGYAKEFLGSVACRICGAGTHTNATTGFTSCVPCPAGTHQLSVGSSRCETCPPGSFSGPRAFSCSSCADGFVAGGNGSSECRQCATGMIANPARTACVACGAGEVPNVARTACVPCAATEVVSLPDGRLGGTPQCQQCPNGFVPVPNRTRCSPCPRGTRAVGTECVPCRAGDVAPEANATECLPCPGNTWSGPGAWRCEPCGHGKVAASRNTACLLCPRGRFHSAPESLECVECAGRNVSVPTRDRCASCDNGTTPDAAHFDCRACPAGTRQIEARCDGCLPGFFSPEPGATECRTCPAGSVSGPSARTCTPCDVGQEAVANTCQDCAPGRFSSDGTGSANATGCSSCPAGRVALARSGACVSCEAGHMPSAAADQCTRCPAGHVSAHGTSCVSCRDGWEANALQSQCDACALGTASTGGAACAACSAGRYAPAANATTCIACPLGRYQNRAGQGECLEPPSGTRATFRDGVLAAVVPCPAGRFSGSGSAATGTEECPSCPPGRVSGAGSSSCTSCGPGTVPAGDKDACETCPAGQTSAAEASVCRPCVAGEFQPVRGGACTRCSAGSAAPVSGLFGACLACDGQTFNNSRGAVACGSCPAAGADCAGGIVRVRDGWWWPGGVFVSEADSPASMQAQAHAGDSVTPETRLYECVNPALCVVTNDYANGTAWVTCRDGHSGVLCSACVPGYAATPTGLCERCGNPALNLVLTILVPIALVLGVIAVVRRSIRRVDRSVRSEERLRRPSTAMGIMRIALNFLQMTATVGGFRFRGPAVFASLASVSEVSGGPALDLYPVACTHGLHFTGRYYATALAPIIGLLTTAACLAVAYACRQVLGPCLPAKTRRHAATDGDAHTARRASAPELGEHERTLKLQQRYVLIVKASAVLVVYVPLIRVVGASLSVFKVHEPDIEGVTVLAEDPSTPAEGAAYTTLSAIAGVVLVVYAALLPASAAAFLARNREHLRSVRLRGWLGWLYEGYDLDHSWLFLWEFVVLLRKIFVAAIANVVANPFLQSYSASWVLLAALLLQLRAAPYKNRVLNGLEALSLGTSLLTQFVTLLYAFAPGLEVIITIVLLAVNIGAVLVFAFYFWRSARKGVRVLLDRTRTRSRLRAFTRIVRAGSAGMASLRNLQRANSRLGGRSGHGDAGARDYDGSDSDGAGDEGTPAQSESKALPGPGPRAAVHLGDGAGSGRRASAVSAVPVHPRRKSKALAAGHRRGSLMGMLAPGDDRRAERIANRRRQSVMATQLRRQSTAAGAARRASAEDGVAGSGSSGSSAVLGAVQEAAARVTDVVPPPPLPPPPPFAEIEEVLVSSDESSGDESGVSSEEDKDEARDVFDGHAADDHGAIVVNPMLSAPRGTTSSLPPPPGLGAAATHSSAAATGPPAAFGGLGAYRSNGGGGSSGVGSRGVVRQSRASRVRATLMQHATSRGQSAAPTETPPPVDAAQHRVNTGAPTRESGRGAVDSTGMEMATLPRGRGVPAPGARIVRVGPPPAPPVPPHLRAGAGASGSRAPGMGTVRRPSTVAGVPTSGTASLRHETTR